MKLRKVTNITQLNEGDIITRSNWNLLKRTMEWGFQYYEAAPNIPLSKVAFRREFCGFGNGVSIPVSEGKGVDIKVLNGVFTIFYYRAIHPLLYKIRRARAIEQNNMHTTN